MKRRFNSMWFGLAVVVGVAVSASFAVAQQRSQPVSSTPDYAWARGTALEHMAVFQRQATDAERLGRTTPAGNASTGEVADALTEKVEGVNADWLPGDTWVERGRILARTDTGRIVFAFPTSKGRVCVGFAGFGSGCLGSFRRYPITMQFGKPDLLPTGEGEPIMAWGIATDDVAAVSFVAAGKTYSTATRNNAYVISVDDNKLANDDIERFTVTMRDGSEIVIPTRGK